MRNACSVCGRRLRRKVKCIETKSHMCKGCCELHEEGCNYHHLCWSSLH
ncbi:MAG: hypothetical protein JXC85_01355 [Candidatus Aenigmarchaeota archaeon]|nr:hypothetical protein [Candidatus Aenigmarchaeota archaeon]